MDIPVSFFSVTQGLSLSNVNDAFTTRSRQKMDQIGEMPLF